MPSGCLDVLGIKRALQACQLYSCNFPVVSQVFMMLVFLALNASSLLTMREELGGHKMRFFVIVASLVMALGLAQARSEDVLDPAGTELLIAALSNCSAFHALTAERAEQIGKSKIARRARALSAGEFALASALAKIAGLPDKTTEYAKAATEAFMAEMGGQIANITAMTHHISACKDVQEHAMEVAKALSPSR